MLCTLGDKHDLIHKGYIYEPKLDGIRAICYVSSKGIKLITRNGIDITHQFPEFKFTKNIKAISCVIDGEIVAYDKKGHPDFNLLQNRGMSGVPATFVVFDILEKNGKSLIHLPLLERKKILESLLKDGNGLEIIVHSTDGKKLWKSAKKFHLEGVIAKKADEIYYPGKRVNHWIKIKFTKDLECVIIGFTQDKRHVSSLALGLYKRGKLYYVGKVGTGFSQADVDDLYKKFQTVLAKESYAVNAETAAKGIIWIKPKFVAEIKYAMMTRDKRLRAPVYMHLRKDKKPLECTFGQIGIH